MKRLSALAVLAATASVVAACGGSSSGGGAAQTGGAKDTTSTAKAAQKGGVLRFGDKVVDCADPHQRGNNPSSYQLKPVTDSLLAQDPKTGEFVEYLLPKTTNIRRVFVDNSTSPVSFWVGSNHGASIVKVEPLD